MSLGISLPPLSLWRHKKGSKMERYNFVENHLLLAGYVIKIHPFYYEIALSILVQK